MPRKRTTIHDLTTAHDLQKEIEGIDLRELARTNPDRLLDLYEAGLIRGIPNEPDPATTDEESAAYQTRAETMNRYRAHLETENQ